MARNHSWRCRCGRNGRIEQWESLAYYVGRHVAHGGIDVWPTGRRHESVTYRQGDVRVNVAPTFWK